MTARSRFVVLWSYLALLLTMAEAWGGSSSIHMQLHGLDEKNGENLRRTQVQKTESSLSSSSSIHLQLHELSEKKRDKLRRTLAPNSTDELDEDSIDHLYQNNSNSTPTPSPTPSNHTDTPAPSAHTPAPSVHTPAPSKHYTPKTDAPSMAPSEAPEVQVGFFRMMGKMLAWCILLYLAVLLTGFCINHKYQIAYYARHAYHLAQIANHWLIQRIRPDDPYSHRSHNLNQGYAAMHASERNDALAQSLFENTHGEISHYEQQQQQANGNNYNTDRGFLMGSQHHSNMGFSNTRMG